jgi:hypothetical protein
MTPKLTPAAAVHRHAGGFVDGQQVLVFQQHREFARRARRRASAGRATRTGGTRTTSPSGQPGVGRRAALVHAHLAERMMR